MTKFIFIFLSICAMSCAVSAPEQSVRNPDVIAYYAGNRPSQVDSFDAAKLTHIIYSFCHLNGARLHVDNASDSAVIFRLVSLKKKNPALRVMLSLGGWGGCETCSDVFSSGENRAVFASSVKELNDYFGTDGIDLDWEYPAIEGYPGHAFKPQDKQNFTDLVRQLRKALGNKNEISFAAGGFDKFMEESVEWNKVMEIADRVNLMTYDLVSGYSTRTGHHTPLYPTSLQAASTDSAVQKLLRYNVPPRKIVIGAAFYGRVWKDVPAVNTGLYQDGIFKEAIAFRDFASKLAPESGFVYHWDSVAMAPFIYHPEKALFVTYDDRRSVQLKTAYAIDKGLGGIMFWELTNDLYSEGLLDAIDAEKRKHTGK